VLLERWPDDFNMLYQVHRALLWDGRVDVAAEVLERMRQVAQGDERWGALPPMRQACAEGRREDAEQILANFERRRYLPALAPADVARRARGRD
jgi:hypothetical protein